MQQSRVNIFAAFRSTSHQGTTRAPRLLQENRGLKFDCARARIIASSAPRALDITIAGAIFTPFYHSLFIAPSRDFHVAIRTKGNCFTRDCACYCSDHLATAPCMMEHSSLLVHIQAGVPAMLQTPPLLPQVGLGHWPPKNDVRKSTSHVV